MSLARYLRERHPVGIIMVTAADGVVDRVVGLEMGADDYVAKPFDPRELRARLKSVLRRVREESSDLRRPRREIVRASVAAHSTSRRVGCSTPKARTSRSQQWNLTC